MPPATPPPTRPRPTTPPLMMPAGATELQPPNIPHTCVAAVVIVCTMGAMDVYLVEQNAGARRLGVGALALAGDLFFLLVLRYATAWVGGEAGPAQRGYAVVLWFLFAFALEIKLYFIYQHYATEGRAPDPLARRTLTLLLSVCVPALYMVLGATETVAQAAASFRKRGELQGRLFWVVLDLLDVLEIQASLWEPQRRVLPLWAEGLAFFYCYGLLLVLPCVSLSELGVRGPQPPASGLYPLLSLASVNVATLFIRGGPLLLCHDQRISAIFMGKNVLAIALKGCAALQHHHHHHHHHHQQATQAREEAGHGGAPGGQSLPASPVVGQQLHQYVGTGEEGCHTHAALLQPPLRCSQSMAGQSRQLLAGAPSQGPAWTPSPLPHRHPSSAGHQTHCLAQFHHPHPHHPHTQILQGACHCYGHTAQPSPTALPTTHHPSASRILRTGPHVQLKSVLAREAPL